MCGGADGDVLPDQRHAGRVPLPVVPLRGRPAVRLPALSRLLVRHRRLPARLRPELPGSQAPQARAGGRRRVPAGRRRTNHGRRRVRRNDDVVGARRDPFHKRRANRCRRTLSLLLLGCYINRFQLTRIQYTQGNSDVTDVILFRI